MFEDCLIESSGKRGSGKVWWISLISYSVQFVFVGIMILVPLIYTEALPKQQMMSFLMAPPPPPPPPPPPADVPIVKVVKPETELDNGQLRTPTKIPQKVAMLKEDDTPPMSAMGGVVGGVPGGVPGGQIGGVIGGIISSTPVAVPRVATPVRVRVSQGVAAGNLIHQVKPLYPQIARAARIQGSVMLQATISKAGAIENLRVVSGHPMLIQAALDAVKQWRYKPYYLNNEPVEVDTQILVNFTLSGG